MDEAKGKAKEAWGAATGDEDKKAEGRAQQRKSAAEKRRPRRKRGPVRQRPKPKGLKKSETSSGGGTVGEARACWAISRDVCRIGRLRMNRWPGPNLQSVAPITGPGFSLCTCSPGRNDLGPFGVPVIGCVANTQRTRGSEGRSVSARTTNGSGG